MSGCSCRERHDAGRRCAVRLPPRSAAGPPARSRRAWRGPRRSREVSPPIELKNDPSRAQLLGDRAGGDDGADRDPVAGALGHRHDVGHDALLLEAPEVVAESSVAHLHLVGDAEAARGPDRRVRLLQVPVGQQDAAGVPVDRFGDEAADPSTATSTTSADRPVDVGGVGGAGVRRRGTDHGRGWATRRRAPTAGGLGCAVRVVGQARWRSRRCRWSTRGSALRTASMSRLPVAARSSRSATSLASLPVLTRNTRVERVGQQRREALGELDHRRVVEAGVGVDEAQLSTDRAPRPPGWLWPRIVTLLTMST